MVSMNPKATDGSGLRPEPETAPGLILTWTGGRGKVGEWGERPDRHPPSPQSLGG